MTLHDLLEGVEVVAMHAPPELSVRGVHYDSRRVLPGQLFFAITGAKTDGLRYVQEAMRRGAAAVAAAAQPAPSGASAADSRVAPGIPWVQLAAPRRALAQAAANFYAHPSRQIETTGVTGTNGKTTTSFLLYAILAAAGNITGLFGTIEYRLGTRRLAAPNTTPESVDLQAMLADLRESGGTHAVMEVSSHALALERVYATRFRVAVFTNLTRDHLDYHGTMQEYFAVKRRLFDGSLGEIPRWAVLNADDPHSAALARCGPKVLWYGLDAPHTDVREAGPLIHTPAGTIANRSRLVGRINSYNRLAAVAAAVALGIPNVAIEEGLESLSAVPGRFESVDAGQPFRIVVDYAHTDDALRNVLSTARGLNPRRIITVFGCGGDRDRKKRPLMGEAAALGSDLVIVTSDNPRSEDPRAIIEEILPGVRQTGKPFEVEPDRAAAIALAIREAQPGDLVLIAGKGHETYQMIGKETISFDDRKVAAKAVQGRMA
jgi:UDP-N-acetylmuramoyl-L-alanyl-D-glutamate--2,6-diaminopimelate ligase